MAVDPEVILMDEPCSALDPIATSRIEDLIFELKFTLHHRDRHAQHAASPAASDTHGLLHDGQDRRSRARRKICSLTEVKETEDYISGRFG